MYNKKFLYICGASFTYGFMRSINGQHDKPLDLVGTKVCVAFVNGVLYANPIYTPLYLLKLVNRIDIKLTGKDPSKYSNEYEDMFSKNNNVFF